MRRIGIVGSFLILAAGVGLAGDLKIVGELKVPEHKMIRLRVDGADPSAAIAWDVLTNEDQVDADDDTSPAGVFRFTAPPGSYRIKAREVSTSNGKTLIRTARATVIIGTAPPTPPPGPTPPGPNPPGPTPPAPDDSLVKKFREAVSADWQGGAMKAHAAKLAEVYSETAKLLADASAANAPKTLGDLYSATFEASVTAGIPRKYSDNKPYLAATRNAVAEALGKFEPAAPLDAAARAAMAAKYLAVGNALAIAAAAQ